MGRQKSRSAFIRPKVVQDELTAEENSSTNFENVNSSEDYFQSNLDALMTADDESSIPTAKEPTTSVSAYNFCGKIFDIGQEKQALDFLYDNRAVDYVFASDFSKTNESISFSNNFQNIINKYFALLDKKNDDLQKYAEEYVRNHFSEQDINLKYKTFLIIMAYATDKLIINYNNRKIRFENPSEMLKKLSSENFKLNGDFIKKYVDVLDFYYFKKVNNHDYCGALSKEIYNNFLVFVSLSPETGKTYFGTREEIKKLLDKNNFVDEKYHAVLNVDEDYKFKTQSFLNNISPTNKAELNTVLRHFVSQSSVLNYLCLLFIKISLMNSRMFVLTNIDEQQNYELKFNQATIFDDLCELASKYVRKQIKPMSPESKKLDIIYLFFKNGIFSGWFADRLLDVSDSHSTIQNYAQQKNLDDFCLAVFDATNSKYIKCNFEYLTYEELIDGMKKTQPIKFLSTLSVYMRDTKFFETLGKTLGTKIDIEAIRKNATNILESCALNKRR